jgi:hypothetical protein
MSQILIVRLVLLQPEKKQDSLDKLQTRNTGENYVRPICAQLRNTTNPNDEWMSYLPAIRALMSSPCRERHHTALVLE